MVPQNTNLKASVAALPGFAHRAGSAIAKLPVRVREEAEFRRLSMWRKIVSRMEGYSDGHPMRREEKLVNRLSHTFK